MTRLVQRELLDDLPPTDPLAIRSRRDLRRLNAWMGNGGIVAKALQTNRPGRAPERLAELGGGDGSLMVNVLRRMRRSWDTLKNCTGARAQGRQLVIVDRHNAVKLETRAELANLGWQVEVIAVDVFDWFEEARGPMPGIMVTNLFLHHFEAEDLIKLLAAIAAEASVFVALEPRRSALASLFSRCVGLIGCGPVTRYDAPVSVRAGFTGCELSQLWPKDNGWCIEERAAGLFGHLFVAKRDRG